MSNLIILYDYHEAPPFLRNNPYIKTGYRAYLPTKLCLRSLFMMTNETVNVWSHLLVGIYFFLEYCRDILLTNQFEDSTGWDTLAFVTMNVCIQVCMFASALFHLFNCQSEAACVKLMLVDCVGIGVGLSGCFFPVMHYAFYCFPHLKLYYGIAIGGIFAVSGYFITRPWFGEKRYTYQRILTYSLLALSGIVPSAHWALLHGIDSEIAATFLPRIFALYCFGGFGCFFYVTRLPESLMPGRFDFFGHSHNIWHVLTAAVFIFGHRTQQLLFLYVKNHECPV